MKLDRTEANRKTPRAPGHADLKVGLHLFQGALANQSRMPKVSSSLVRAGLVDRIVVTAVEGERSEVADMNDPVRQCVRFRSVVAGERRGQMWRALRAFELTLRILWTFGRRRFTVITCHSLPLLPAAVVLSKLTRASLVYSPHELETEWVNSRGLRRMISRVMERILIRDAHAVIVVSPSIAVWYRENYPGVEVTVVRNIPPGDAGITERDDRLRKRFAIDEHDLVFLYQGGLGPGRAIPLLLKVFAQGAPPGRHLIIMGKGPHAAEVRAAARECRNIHFMPMVASQDSGRFTAGADIGLNVIENICLSYYYSLGNKVFEYINSGVPVLVSHFPDMSEIVETHRCGWTVEPTEKALLAFVTSVSKDDIARCRNFALIARKQLTWENEEELLLATYRTVLARRLSTSTPAQRLAPLRRPKLPLKTTNTATSPRTGRQAH